MLCPSKRGGMFQGILGSAINLGLAVGPFITSAFVEHTGKSWRGSYFFLAPSIFLVSIASYLILPTSRSALSRWEIVTTFDYLGLFLFAAFLVFILVPVNGGGNLYPWDSALVISMFTISGGLLFIFLFVEWKFARLPVIPLRIFKNLTVTQLMFQSFLYGMAYCSVNYYLPYYVELVRELSVLKSCSYLAITQFTAVVTSTISGQILNYLNGYNYIIWFGFAIWTLANGLMLTVSIDSPLSHFGAFMMLIGIAIGFTFQPTILAVQANCDKRDRALALSIRNMLRAVGNSVGVAISSLIYTNTLVSEVHKNTTLPQEVKQEILSNAYSKPDLSKFTAEQKLLLKKMLMSSMRNIFILWIPLIAVCLVLSLFVKDHDLSLLAQQQRQSQQESINKVEKKDIEVITLLVRDGTISEKV